jgi:transcriptional regulator with XRE-family HTH domain
MGKRVEKIPIKYRKEVRDSLDYLAMTLRNRRKAAKLTQEELAEILDISTASIQHIEQGRRSPSLPMLFYIFKILKVNFKLD